MQIDRKTDPLKWTVNQNNLVSKWAIENKVTFIGFDLTTDSLYTFLEIENIRIHLEAFDEETVVNCFDGEVPILMGISGTTEECLTELTQNIGLIELVIKYPSCK